VGRGIRSGLRGQRYDLRMEHFTMSYLSQSAVEFSALGKAVQKALEAQSWRDYYWYQLKYDGVSGIVFTGLPGFPEDGRMRSRTGERAMSCDHIVAECRRIFGPDMVVFGEVYKHGWEQPEISGAFRRQSPQPELEFVVFDMITADEYAAGLSERIYSERHLEYSSALRSGDSPGIVFAAETRLPEHTSEDVVAAHAVHQGGFDGYIRRDPRSSWTPGKDKRGVVLKFKPTVTFDLELIGTEEGKGRNKGRVGALLFRFRGDKVVKAGAIPDELRDNPPALGTIHEIEAMSESTQGVLREPRYKGQRFDKDKPDF
jgi:DNA ligase-1